MYNLYNMKSCCTYCANRSYFVHKSVQQLRIFQGFLFYCSVLLQIVQNLTVLYGVLCNILKDPFKSASEKQMVTRNFGLMFAAPSLRRTQGTFLISADVPSQNDAARTWPSARPNTIDLKRDADLANAVSTTEIMVADFYKTGYLTRSDPFGHD